VPITGCDIGGFANGDGSEGTFAPLNGQCAGVTNYELLTRWMQLGSFLPWFRNHYDGYSKGFQEPYKYGDPVPANCRKYVQLRYTMMQIYYDAMYQATQTGIPVARPLFLNDPQDPQAYQYCNDQFFVGDHVLVAPVLTQGNYYRDVYLPAGSDWYAFQNNQAPLLTPVGGGTLVQGYYADLTLVPVYVRAGAILPMQELEQYVGQLPTNPLTFNIYPGPGRSYQLYQDDGESTDYRSGSYRLTTISHGTDGASQWVRVQRAHDQYAPPSPFYYVALLLAPGQSPPNNLTVNGQAIANLGTNNSGALAKSTVNAFYFNSTINITFAKVFDTQSEMTLQAQ
jgi:alpha-glucosidase